MAQLLLPFSKGKSLVIVKICIFKKMRELCLQQQGFQSNTHDLARARLQLCRKLKALKDGSSSIIGKSMQSRANEEPLRKE